jgi:phenylalanyl-tRNA synthetase alpha chain
METGLLTPKKKGMIPLKEQLDNIQKQALAEIQNASDIKSVDDLKIRLLGKKGELTAILKQMGKLSAEERPVIGQLANEVRQVIETDIARRREQLKSLDTERRLKKEVIDVTLPGKRMEQGGRHPLNIVLDELKEIFKGMGYSIVDGPEVEETKYVFDMLNTDEGHPARDMQDTFYITDNILLRTQTSSVQIRTMLKTSPPIAVISPGKVYRNDSVDATHSPIFHQCEGLVVDKGITFGDLKGTIETFAKRLYGSDVKIRFRPHHFPYTEPSAEADFQCFKCGGKGCPLCKGEGWIELLGCGVVHPQVLLNCGIDPDVYSGFAFGVGLERLAMMRYAIDDMRLLYENDLRFLKQF